MNDLSAEHKRTRLALDTGTCEERSICRLLVAAGEDGAELLKEMLVYAAERYEGRVILFSVFLGDKGIRPCKV